MLKEQMQCLQLGYLNWMIGGEVNTSILFRVLIVMFINNIWVIKLRD